MRCPLCNRRPSPWRMLSAPRRGRTLRCAGCGARLERARRTRAEVLVDWLVFWPTFFATLRFLREPSWGAGLAAAALGLVGACVAALMARLEPARGSSADASEGPRRRRRSPAGRSLRL